MKTVIIIISLFIVNSCSITKKINNANLSGKYFMKSDKLYQAFSDQNYSSLELHDDGTYTLYTAEILFTPIFEQCAYASRGKWKMISENVVEITSEDYYLKQDGFKYYIKKDNKFSNDSLYIGIEFPSDFHPVNMAFKFNENHLQYFKTNKINNVLAKSDFLTNARNPINRIKFEITPEAPETKIYKSRMLFEIFDELIDTKRYNFLTIVLPYFNRCFFQFEPYFHELIYVNTKNQLIWQGNTWIKQ